MAAAATTADNNKEADDSDLAEWISLSERIATALDPKTLVQQYWQAQSRPDGRLLYQCRPTTVVPDVFSHAAGSALVRLSDQTQVAAAVTWQIGQQTNAAIAGGDVWVTIERTASFYPTHFTALQAYLQRILMETLGLTQLQISPGRAWRALVTVHVLKEGGNTTDAALLAAVAALQRSRIPIDLVEQHGKLWTRGPNGPTKPFQMPSIPISLTIGQWKHPKSQQILWIVDPTAEEEAALEGTLTLVVQGATLQGVQFSGLVVNFVQHLPMLQTLAIERAKEIQTILQTDRE